MWLQNSNNVKKITSWFKKYNFLMLYFINLILKTMRKKRYLGYNDMTKKKKKIN